MEFPEQEDSGGGGDGSDSGTSTPSLSQCPTNSFQESDATPSGAISFSYPSVSPYPANTLPTSTQASPIPSSRPFSASCFSSSSSSPFPPWDQQQQQQQSPPTSHRRRRRRRHHRRPHSSTSSLPLLLPRIPLHLPHEHCRRCVLPTVQAVQVQRQWPLFLQREVVYPPLWGPPNGEELHAWNLMLHQEEEDDKDGKGLVKDQEQRPVIAGGPVVYFYETAARWEGCDNDASISRRKSEQRGRDQPGEHGEQEEQEDDDADNEHKQKKKQGKHEEKDLLVWDPFCQKYRLVLFEGVVYPTADGMWRQTAMLRVQRDDENKERSANDLMDRFSGGSGSDGDGWKVTDTKPKEKRRRLGLGLGKKGRGDSFPLVVVTDPEGRTRYLELVEEEKLVEQGRKAAAVAMFRELGRRFGRESVRDLKV